MDPKKDNQSILKDTEKSLFYKDPYIAFSIKKTDRIVKAIYLVSNFLDIKEPLKWAVRETALKVMERVSHLGISSLADREKIILDICGKASELVTLVETACTAGFMSIMNAEIIIREINVLVRFVQEKNAMHYASSSVLEVRPSFFFVEEPKSYSTMPSKGQESIKDKENVFNKKPLDSLNNSKKPDVVKDKFKDKNNRRYRILAITKKDEYFSIKDVSGVLKDCSEKTIQRELLDMVSEGVLIKEGERRWSRYKVR